MVKKSEYPIPQGFTWNHTKDIYVHDDGRMWNSDSNTFYDKAGIEIPQVGERVASEGDRRTDNNVMRHEYRILSDAEKAQMVAIKDLGSNFVTLCDSLGQSRELSLAKTNIEQAVMWAVKHLTK